jgi:hypothetical protein
MKTFSEYLNAVSRVNRLGNGQAVEWLFHPGMLFSSMDKWWGDFGFRSSAHEGIDITYFRTPAEEILCFDDSVQIPAMEDGRIINICDDFLGRTLVVETINQGFPETRVIYTYAHIRPEIRLTIGHCVKKDEVIARVCDTRKNPQLPPHLHFSCFEIEKGVLPRDLNWNLFSNDTAINRVNPVFL